MDAVECVEPPVTRRLNLFAGLRLSGDGRWKTWPGRRDLRWWVLCVERAAGRVSQLGGLGLWGGHVQEEPSIRI